MRNTEVDSTFRLDHGFIQLASTSACRSILSRTIEDYHSAKCRKKNQIIPVAFVGFLKMYFCVVLFIFLHFSPTELLDSRKEGVNSSPALALNACN